MVKQINPPELQLDKANNTDAETPFLGLHLSIAMQMFFFFFFFFFFCVFFFSKIYDKRDDFCFDIVNFPFLDGDVPRCASYGVHISQVIRFA